MKKILVVDDEPDITNSIKKGLELQGFEVDAYTDPQQALLDFKSEVYDLVILDIRMPKINGFQLYREIIKRDDKTRICFITGFEECRKEFKQAFPELDESRFIKKPISLNALTEYILKLQLTQPLNVD